MNVVEIKTGALSPYNKNAKKHSKEQISAVAESIKQFGFVQPVVIDKDNVIVIGHCRVLAAKKIGMEAVPCVMVDDLTDEQVKQLRIIDNKSNESPWDMAILQEELGEINLSGFEFDFGSEEEKADIHEIELAPYQKVHYLISLDINDNPKVADIISKLGETEGVTVASTLN